MYLFTFFLSLLLLPITVHASVIRQPKACNGHPELCNRKYSNITFIGSHDAPFVGSLPSDNQDLSITAQLNAGIRFLQGQTHKSPSLLGNSKTLDLCHSKCLLEDAGSLTSFLTTLKTWLDNNPNEVLTLLLTNGDNVDISLFSAAFTAANGITKYTFTPTTTSGVPLQPPTWPTLSQLITANTRLVVFLDYGANTAKTPYILDEFAYFFEDAFDTTDPSFADCSVNRPPHADPKGRMYIANHFLSSEIAGLDVPDRADVGTTNAATGGKGSIGKQAGTCAALYGRNPNCVLVDFEDKGQVFRAQSALNGLS